MISTVHNRRAAGLNVTALRGVALLCALVCALWLTVDVRALDASHYAESSRLASGKWVRVKADGQGLQSIDDAELRRMGFSQPEKVRVYGYGGRAITDGLHARQPDDLPPVPCFRRANSLYFPAKSQISWSGGTALSTYSHQQHPYSSAGWYLLSDTGEDADFISEQRGVASARTLLTTFREHLLHERELVAPSNSGRMLLGEDFRSARSRTISFTLSGLQGDSALIAVAMGTNVTGSSSVILSANGKRLSSTEADRLPGITSDQFIRQSIIEKNAAISGQKLDITIDYSYTGMIRMANLDYIRVEYDRALELERGQLLFHGIYRYDQAVSVGGVTADTQIWEISDVAGPVRIDWEMDNGRAVFSPGNGYREFVAFDPSKAEGKALTDWKPVACQDFHSMPSPDMLIISPEEYLDASERLAAHHRSHDSMTVYVATPQQLYNEFSSGTPDVGAFRRALKMWYDREPDKMRYCLIMSRPTYDNRMVTAQVAEAGYPRVPIWQSPTGQSPTTSYSTDAYIGMLDDSSDASFSMRTAKQRVAVGRLPVKSLREANEVVSKIIAYAEQPQYGIWRNNVVIIADDQDNGVHLEQAENVYANMKSSGNGSHFIYDRLYLDSFQLAFTGTGAAYPEASRRLQQRLAEGVLAIDYIGHASIRGWGHEGLLTWSDIVALDNSRLPFIYAATCEFARWDDNTVSGAEMMLLNPTAGTVGMIVPSRSVYISQNGVLNSRFGSTLFARDSENRGKRWGDIYVETMNTFPNADDNKLRYCLLADPALRLPSPTHEIKVETIGGVAVEELTSGFPEIQAHSQVEVTGSVVNPDGTPAESFQGTLEFRLYDGETVVETNGNGADGKVSVYNDRTTLLSTGATTVKDGRWATTLLMPSEISNNYTPGLLAAYAHDPATGVEANGSSEKFFVYGYDSESHPDTEGPEISELYLNHRSFTPGSAIGRQAVFFAKVRDESGINMSDAGIGHKMLLRLDSSAIFDDLNLSYVPDPADVRAGSVQYALGELEPGRHTLEFEVWDNANNSTRRQIDFNVAAASSPVIFDLTPDCNPASTAVVFSLTTDRPATRLKCEVDVFDLSGRKVWSEESDANTGMESSFNTTWNLCDSQGVRVARGIYLYRATVTTPEGTYTTKTHKLAVTAP